jgi:hypothetical protein
MTRRLRVFGAGVVAVVALAGCGTDPDELLVDQTESMARTCQSFLERRGGGVLDSGASATEYLERRDELLNDNRKPTWVSIFRDVCDPNTNP